jgi:hypothetical protein
VVDRGAMKPGPSEDYLALLRGDITSEEYVRRLKATVDERRRNWPNALSELRREQARKRGFLRGR